MAEEEEQNKSSQNGRHVYIKPLVIPPFFVFLWKPPGHLKLKKDECLCGPHQV